MADPVTRSPDRASPWPFVGMIGLACLFFLIAASVLTTPWYAVAGLLVVWAMTLVVALRWWTPHPGRVPWLAVGLGVVWLGTVVGGAVLFGWGG